MSKVQIHNFNEREVKKLNNPRKCVFLTDVLWNAVFCVFGAALILGTIFSVCALCDLGFRLMGVA